MKKHFSKVLFLAFFVSMILSPFSGTSAATKKQAVKDYDYELVDQQPSDIIKMQPGEIKTVWIEVKNTGSKTWYVDGTNPVRLGYGSLYADTYNTPGYNYLISKIAYIDHSDLNAWISFDRTANMSDGKGIISEVKPGWNTRFQFKIKAPQVAGVYKEYFTPVVEGLEWMKDLGIYWDIRVLGENNYMPKEIYLWPNMGNETANAQVGDTVYIGLNTASITFFDRKVNSDVLQYIGRKMICDSYNQNINTDIDTCNKTATRALYGFRAISKGTSVAGIDDFPSATITVSGNRIVQLYSKQTEKLTIGDIIKVATSLSDSENFQYDSKVLSYMCTGYTNYFKVLSNGFTRIENGNFSANIIVGENYHIYETVNIPTKLPYILSDAKTGDIIIVQLRNPGDGGYSFGDPQIDDSNGVKLLEHKHFASTSGATGDFGSDQWVFQVANGSIADSIKIISYRPWEYKASDSSTYTTNFWLVINPLTF